MTPYYARNGVVIYCADCRDVLPTLGPFKSIITDPPYHLTSVSRKGSSRTNDPASPFGRHRIGERGFMGKTWDGGGVSFDPETWLSVLEAAKPGAMLLSFGGTRTWHRIAAAIEDAGWEIRDTICWLYGSGFPKSLNIGKSAGRAEWEGWGTALKPAFEPIIVAMKPLDGTFAENALAHGVAGLNIDGCRIGENPGYRYNADKNGTTFHGQQGERIRQTADKKGAQFIESTKGRWPANLILDDEAAALLDEQSGKTVSRAAPRGGTSPNPMSWGQVRADGQEMAGHTDSGGASRFFYCAKASCSERGEGNDHPTVKPLALMRYLCRLTKTPSGGLVLDPFMGSGSTLLAARLEGRPCIGIEKDERTCEIAVKRLEQLENVA